MEFLVWGSLAWMLIMSGLVLSVRGDSGKIVRKTKYSTLWFLSLISFVVSCLIVIVL